MKLDEYNRIVKDYHKLEKKYGINESKLIVDKLVALHGHSYQVIYNICAYDYRNKMKDAVTLAIRPRPNWGEIISQWDNGSSVFEVAKEHQLEVNVVLRQLVLHAAQFNREESKNLIRDSNTCDNGRLAFEIELCQQHDIMNGTFNNHLNHVYGLHFEAIVHSQLARHNVSYRSETELRQNRYDVTPDFLLNVPLVLIRLQDGGLRLAKVEDEPEKKLEGEISPRSVVNWLECKASFGSIKGHAEYYDAQFFAYRNRFGPGLVLYSLGYVDEMPTDLLDGITLTQQMPPFCSQAGHSN